MERGRFRSPDAAGLAAQPVAASGPDVAGLMAQLVAACSTQGGGFGAVAGPNRRASLTAPTERPLVRAMPGPELLVCRAAAKQMPP